MKIFFHRVAVVELVESPTFTQFYCNGLLLVLCCIIMSGAVKSQQNLILRIWIFLKCWRRRFFFQLLRSAVNMLPHCIELGRVLERLRLWCAISLLFILTAAQKNIFKSHLHSQKVGMLITSSSYSDISQKKIFFECDMVLGSLEVIDRYELIRAISRLDFIF